MPVFRTNRARADQARLPRHAWLPFAVCLAALSGCAATSSEPTAYTGWQSQQQNLLDERISSYLDGASAGALYQPTVSPWGRDVTLTVDDTYHAASGRPCREVQVEAAAGVQRVLACRASDTRWAEVRSLR